MQDTARTADFKTGLGGQAMHGIITASVSSAAGFLRTCWSGYRARRERARVRAILCGMPDRELKDIGISRGEIEYVVSSQVREW